MPYQGYCSIAMEDWPAWTFTGLSPGTTYLVKISVRDADQNVIGSAVTRHFSTAGRPAKWSWESTVSAGKAINMTAAEFNRFIDHVYEMMEYAGVSDSSVPSDHYVTKGARMKAGDVKDIREIIAGMDPPQGVPAAVSAGDTITAAFFDGLKNSLNSIQ